MEMNTRLQVEHPVTECITGLDLVEWQIKVAQGEALPLAGGELKVRGAAVEVRLYAEDPSQGYLPSVGRITHLAWPSARAEVRLDVGFQTGDEVSSFYDPMLGKLVCWGETRDIAIDRLRAALEDTEVAGVLTNRALLVSILGEAEFRAGGVGTNYLSKHQSDLKFGEPSAGAEDLADAALWLATRRREESSLWEDTRGWRAGAAARSSWTLNDKPVTVMHEGDARYRINAGQLFEALLIARADDALELERDGVLRRVRVVAEQGCLHLYRAGGHVQVKLTETEDSLQAADTAEQGSLLTPLPGTIVAVHVTLGEQVQKGAPLVTVEAMKMEHTLTAPYAGQVAKLAFKVSERVAAGAVLVELTADKA
jgi:3-methylcrotonyl-CoA carboxylase alpha subunit